MTDIMNLSKKIAFGVAVGFFGITSAQTLQDGVANADSHKYAKAKEVFTQMIAKSPTAENYFYLGNSYLTQFEPNFETAQENFNKGLAEDKRSNLNKIGLASVKLGKGDKSAVMEIQNIVKDSRDKDAEVLYRAAEALTIFGGAQNADLAIDYLNRAVDKSQRSGTPAYYYYTLGDAYRLKLTNSPQVAGSAMTAYDKALPVAKNKASVYTRIGTLWMQAQRWQQAKESIEKAIAADPTYAPAYKAKAGYDIKYQQNALATQDLVNYAKYADEDPDTQLEISKLFFTNEDYGNSKMYLDKVFDKVKDPIKFKLRSYLLFEDGDYAGAKSNMDLFVSQAEKSRVTPGDTGLMGLIAAGLAEKETDATIKSGLVLEAQNKVAVAKAAKDKTLNWDEELIKIKGGGGISQDKVDEGGTTPAIDAAKVKVAANPQDTNALFELANAYQEAKNFNGEVQTWKKMSGLLPDWAPAYYSQGIAYQQLKNYDLANIAFEKYVTVVNPAEAETNKKALAYAYYSIASFVKDTDPAKAKDYVGRSVMFDPTSTNATQLQEQLNK